MKILMSIAGFKMYKERNKQQFIDFVEKYGFSVIEIKLVYRGLSPIGVIIGKK